jgi:hypothetical protein
MDTLLVVVRVVHVIAGTLALVIGTVISFLPKGDARHKALGRWFVYGMFTVTVSAAVMAIYYPNSFLLLMALFAGYLTFVGWRTMLWPRKKDAGLVPPVLLLLIGLSQFVVAATGNAPNVVVTLFFGVLISLLALNEIRVVRAAHAKPPTRSTRYRRHITLMGGALISSWTAFAVVNLPGPWSLVGWILPSVAGTVFITAAIRRHARQ